MKQSADDSVRYEEEIREAAEETMQDVTDEAAEKEVSPAEDDEAKKKKQLELIVKVISDQIIRREHRFYRKIARKAVEDHVRMSSAFLYLIRSDDRVRQLSELARKKPEELGDLYEKALQKTGTQKVRENRADAKKEGSIQPPSIGL